MTNTKHTDTVKAEASVIEGTDAGLKQLDLFYWQLLSPP